MTGEYAGTAVIYARFSSSKQREASIDDQLRVCREWCAREGYAIVAEYCDYALSGRSDDRPQFQQMIANAGESDIALVYMMDRFSRGEYDAPIYKRELSLHGVRLVSALEQIPDSPEGIIYEKLLEGLAACESRKTSVRVRRGMEGNALKCMTNGVRVFGYGKDEDDRYVVDPEQARFVVEAFERRIKGEAVNSIAKDFARRGVKTYTGRPCAYTMVYKMLKSEKYTGVYEWGGIRHEGGMPAIIDRETFMAAQMVQGKKQRKNEEWGEFALSGRVICSGCGHSMPGVSGRGSKGKKYDYYACKRCDMKSVRKDWLEQGIVDALREMLSSRDEALRIARMMTGSSIAKASEERRKAVQNSKQSAEQGLANILAAIEQGIIAPGVKERIAQLEGQRDEAERELSKLKMEEVDPEEFADFLQFGATLDDASLLDAFVWQVMVTPDEAIVTLNYDSEKNEPARFSIQRVRTILEWCGV